jgi:membrane-bound metal-dependent hydrolase YbcI (DUF457 family)
MFVGHLAAAFGARAVEPRVPLGVAVASAFALDLAWPVLLLVGLETVRVQPGDTAFTHLAFEAYPWSHSLALVLVWSSLAGLLAFVALRSPRAGVVTGVLVLSHWVLDALTHRPDLPLWPHGPVVGIGLWYSIPATLIVEGGLLALGLTAYLRATRPRNGTGRLALGGLVMLTTLIWVTQPWAPPPPSARAVAFGGLALWLFVPWAAWIERHRG